MNESLDLQELTKQLTENRLLSNNEEIKKFETAITEILNKGDIDHIKSLCRGFYDATENDEVMFGLIHAIESYDQDYSLENTLEKLASSIPVMLPHAYEWLKIFHKRILNHPESKSVYAKIIKDIGNEDIKGIVDKQMNEIKSKNPQKFHESVNYILSVIN